MSKRAAILATVVLLVAGSNAMAVLRIYEGFNYYVPDVGEQLRNDGPGGTIGTFPGVFISDQGNNGTNIGFDPSDGGTSYGDSGYAAGTVSELGGDYDGTIGYDPTDHDSSNIPYPSSVNATAAMTPTGGHLYDCWSLVGHSRTFQSSAVFGDSLGAGTYYYSFLMNKWYDSYFGTITLASTTGNRVEMGYGGGTNMILGTGGTVTYTGGAPSVFPNHQPTWLVAEIVVTGDANPDTVTMYVNPDASQPIAASTPYAISNDADLGDLTQITSFGWGRDSRFDEIRVADSWSDLVNTPAPVTADVPATNDTRTGAAHEWRLESTGDGNIAWDVARGPGETKTPGGGNTKVTYYWHPELSVGETGSVVRFDVDDSLAAGDTITDAKMVMTGYMLFEQPLRTKYMVASLVTTDWDDDDSDPTLTENSATFVRADPTTAVDPADPTTAAGVVGWAWAGGDGLMEMALDPTVVQGWADGSIADYGLYIELWNSNGTPLDFSDDFLETGRRSFISREHVANPTDPGNPGIEANSYDPGDGNLVYSDFGYGYWGMERPVLVINEQGVTPPPHIGDANGDGVVDLQDFGVLKANYGTTTGATWAQGDFNGDGAVDLQDFGLLKSHYGHTAGDPLSTVPEPATMSLLALGGLAVLRRRRK